MQNKFFLYGILLCHYINSRCNFKFFFDHDSAIDIHLFCAYRRSLELYNKIDIIYFSTTDLLAFRSAIAILDEELTEFKYYMTNEDTVNVVYYDYLINIRYLPENNSVIDSVFYNNINFRLVDINTLLSIKLSEYENLNNQDFLKILSLMYLLRKEIQYNNILIYFLQIGLDIKKMCKYLNRLLKSTDTHGKGLCNVSLEKQIKQSQLFIDYFNV